MKSQNQKHSKEVPVWAQEQIEAERLRCHCPAHVALFMARNACAVCGSIVIMHDAKIGGGATCVSCGAHGGQRSKHWAGNMYAFEPKNTSTTRHYEYGTHGTSCNPVSDALGNF
jgi:hypothetical protein